MVSQDENLIAIGELSTSTETPQNPGRTPDDEYEDRVELTYRMLVEGMRKSEIKAALKAQYQISARTAENYLARARLLQLEDLREERDVHRASSLAFYKSVLSDPQVGVGAKINAQKRIDQLLGLDVPFRVAIASANVGRDQGVDDIDSMLSVATVDELKVMRGLYERRSDRSSLAQ
ncbi:hypothetical protein VN12_26725 [Pirellula sp. SH-Sr6A]|uniref:hypothetical protein n=1 Tax=Pirellula sp. SH-Sr6A TaxID=1632865 RepID=UPI00078B5C36|nr:hypothetical protein [Pirellula sp. SH-Sr6A]AMV35716.1 hypothetical protein VN12_26725 [Pirellula sp. SH-Sr6A]